MLSTTDVTSARPAIVTSCLVSFSSCSVSGDFDSSWRCSMLEMWADLGRHPGRGDDELAGAAGHVWCFM
jgi:hypothetical protein